MQIAESALDEEHPMRADFNGDKIMVILSKKDFAQYKLLKLNESFVGPLTTIIVLNNAASFNWPANREDDGYPKR